MDTSRLENSEGIISSVGEIVYWNPDNSVVGYVLSVGNGIYYVKWMDDGSINSYRCSKKWEGAWSIQRI
jgi:hypothetical protein